MKKILFIMPFFLFILYGTQCSTDQVYYFEVHNQSQETIFACLSITSDMTSQMEPDTSLPRRYYYVETLSASPRSQIDIVVSNPGVFDTVSVFILNVDTLTKYTWNEVRRDYNIRARYDLSSEDWRKLNMTVTYPPSEEMKNMKMFPPYKYWERLKDSN